jgi:hypothetical protein
VLNFTFFSFSKLSPNSEILQVFIFPSSELNVSRIETKGQMRAGTPGWQIPRKGCSPSHLDWHRSLLTAKSEAGA